MYICVCIYTSDYTFKIIYNFHDFSKPTHNNNKKKKSIFPIPN